MEDKQEILTHLKWLLKATRAGQDIDRLLLSEDEKTVSIVFCSGHGKDINIECDSGIAIVQDVAKALL